MEEFNTFDEFERSQAVSTASAVTDIEDKLYEYNTDFNHDDANVAEKQDMFSLSRYSTGYSAHNEVVDSKEFAFWKNSFPYLRVKGSGMNIHTLPMESHEEYLNFEDEVILENFDHINKESSNSLRDEILSNVLHQIWPEVVDVVTPLLVEILKELKCSNDKEVDEIDVWKNESPDEDFMIGSGDNFED